MVLTGLEVGAMYLIVGVTITLCTWDGGRTDGDAFALLGAALSTLFWPLYLLLYLYQHYPQHFDAIKTKKGKK